MREPKLKRVDSHPALATPPTTLKSIGELKKFKLAFSRVEICLRIVDVVEDGLPLFREVLLLQDSVLVDGQRLVSYQVVVKGEFDVALEEAIRRNTSP